jgi:hypothetical protein
VRRLPARFEFLIQAGDSIALRTNRVHQTIDRALLSAICSNVDDAFIPRREPAQLSLG